MGDLEKTGTLAGEGNVVKLVGIEPTWMWSHRTATLVYDKKLSLRHRSTVGRGLLYAFLAKYFSKKTVSK